MRATDADALRAGMARMSDASLYQRFMTAMPTLSDQQLRYFSDVDNVDHVAIGARDPGAPPEDGNPEGLGIGTARYIRSRTDPTCAELAVTVVDAYQRLGLGGILLDALIEHAAGNGIRTLTAEMLTENRAIKALLRSRGFTLTRTAEASVTAGHLDLG